jgi:hypothetical protein
MKAFCTVFILTGERPGMPLNDVWMHPAVVKRHCGHLANETDAQPGIKMHAAAIRKASFRKNTDLMSKPLP